MKKEISKCQECGKPTNNPKFCCKSCAVKFNNRISPKRKPEGHCERCGVGIHTRERFCEDCMPIYQLEVDRKVKNIKVFATPEGNKVEVPIPHARTHKSIVFESYIRQNGKELSCGDVVEKIMAIVFSEPEYIRNEDVLRHGSLLYSFYNFKCEIGYQPKQICCIQEMNIEDIFFYLQRWIESFMDRKSHPLLPTLAIDTARVVEAHLEGRSFDDYDGKRWEIKSILETDIKFNKYFGFLDKMFKKEITESNIGKTICHIRIPKNILMVFEYNKNITFSEGDELLFEVKRCHLSQTVYGGYSCFEIREEDKPLFDISEELIFHGEILLNRSRRLQYEKNGIDLSSCFAKSADDLDIVWGNDSFTAEIPVRWITGTYQPYHDELSGESKYLFEPVPKWSF